MAIKHTENEKKKLFEFGMQKKLMATQTSGSK